MRESSSNILLHLLRAALGNEAAGGELPSDIDWQEVIDMSFEQGVAAIAVDGLQLSLELIAESLELALDSPELEDLKYEWFGSVFQAEEDYKKYVEDIASLAKTYGSITFRVKKALSSQKKVLPLHYGNRHKNTIHFRAWFDRAMGS